MLRFRHDGKPLTELLGVPVPSSEGRFRAQWLGLCDGEDRLLQYQGWVRAWHGTKLEALYCTMCEGALRPSSSEDKGERFFTGAPGVYAHKDATQHKADNYTRFVQLCPAGFFFAAKWEARVDRHELVRPPQQTGQLVQKSSGVRLAALWA